MLVPVNQVATGGRTTPAGDQIKAPLLVGRKRGSNGQNVLFLRKTRAVRPEALQARSLNEVAVSERHHITLLFPRTRTRPRALPFPLSGQRLTAVDRRLTRWGRRGGEAARRRNHQRALQNQKRFGQAAAHQLRRTNHRTSGKVAEISFLMSGQTNLHTPTQL